jgi:general transcription factor 3C polypeptide 3 (transcription factor C subunit 4)
LGEANLAYVTAERDKAIEILQEVIRIEPGIIQPWITLATIHSELGDEEKALRFRVIAATLQPKDIDNWKDIARQSRQFGLLSQAIYCYTQASRADRDDVDALWDRAYLHREMGNYRRSAATLKQILRILPHDPFIVRNLMSDYIKASNIQEACAVGQACLSFQRYDQPHGPARNANESAYTLEDLYTLSTLQNGLHRYADAIRTVKTGVRWMQGREDEVWWDSHPDDREYDVERTEDRMPPPERADATATHALDTRLRLVLGQARLAGTFKDKQEAKVRATLIPLG